MGHINFDAYKHIDSNTILSKLWEHLPFILQCEKHILESPFWIEREVLLKF